MNGCCWQRRGFNSSLLKVDHPSLRKWQMEKTPLWYYFISCCLYVVSLCIYHNVWWLCHIFILLVFYLGFFRCAAHFFFWCPKIFIWALSPLIFFGLRMGSPWVEMLKCWKCVCYESTLSFVNYIFYKIIGDIKIQRWIISLIVK